MSDVIIEEETTPKKGKDKTENITDWFKGRFIPTTLLYRSEYLSSNFYG